MKSTRLVHEILHRPVYRNLTSITRTCTPLQRVATRPLPKPPTIRHATTFQKSTQWFKKHWNDARRDTPVLLYVSLVGAIGITAVLGLLIYDEYTNIAPQYAAYPDVVEQHLRYALHLTHVQADPDGAAKQFSKALQQAYVEGMDPFSKEVMGIRIRWAEMFEKFGRAQGAIEILKAIVTDCEEKLTEIETSVEGEQNTIPKGALLKMIIQMKVKAAGIYESEYLQDPHSAKHILSEAVSLLVQETKNPETNGFSEDNAAGLSLAEISAILSQMADLYATSGEESNAVQVYMLTLAPLRQSCNGTKTCKEVQILSNIASTMTVAMKRPGATINGKPPTKTSMEAARRATIKWADQAIGTAENVKPEDRDQMCELGLISAEMTKADLLLESGQNLQARELFRSLIPRLREKNLQALVNVAEQSLQRAS